MKDNASTLSESKVQSSTDQDGIKLNDLKPAEVHTTSIEVSSNTNEQEIAPVHHSKSRLKFLNRFKKSSTTEEVNPEIMTLQNPPKNRHRFISCCFWLLILGMNDGVVGALLSSIEDYYDIEYTIVSLLWMGNAIGYVLIAFTGHYLRAWLGLTKMIILSNCLFILSFSIIASGVKYFAIICIGFFFSGLGCAIAFPLFNLFLSKMNKSHKYLGIFHGIYGVGGFLAPLIGTAIIDKHGQRAWHYFFLIPLGLSVLSLVYITLSWNNADIDLPKWIDHDDEEPETQEVNEDLELKQPSQSQMFLLALKSVKVWLCCAFIFFYVGSEVAVSGWVVTFLSNNRDVDENSVGYVSSGFWAGITLGRLILTPILSHHIGIRRSIYIFGAFIVGLDILIWFVPNIYANGLFVSVMGLLLGPIYPMVISLVTHVLPLEVRYCGMTLSTAFGSSGASVMPFVVGLASDLVGTYVLHPVFLGCYAILFATLTLMPNVERKGPVDSIWKKLW